MQSPENSIEASYRRHKAHFEESGEELARLQKAWFEDDTVDYWRHSRMVAPLKPLLDHYKNSRWLTVGDGRFGLDAVRLKRMQPGLEILPTDIAPALLIRAKEQKLIADFREENAEALSFSDGSFDFCFCKESYHHFPRPYMALYEMLRVAKHGVVLIEPNDRQDKMFPERIINGLKRAARKITGRAVAHHYTWDFETSGNFIYKISENEIEKVALGIQLPAVAFHYSNDYYEAGVEFEKAVPGNKLFEKVKRKIGNEDLKCRLGLNTYSNIIAILFKHPVDQLLKQQLRANGFSVIDLPENPFLK